MTKALLQGSRYQRVNSDWWKPTNNGRRVPWTFRESDVTAERTQQHLRWRRPEEAPPDDWTDDEVSMIWEMKLAVHRRNQTRFKLSWLRARLRYPTDTIHRFFDSLVTTGSARRVDWDMVEIIDEERNAPHPEAPAVSQ
jgi:hypothetical protein